MTETHAPRTYQTAWLFNEDGTAKLVTAEEWLEAEADVHGALEEGDTANDGPSTAGVMRAIAKEIATLRRERTQWAEECTLLAQMVTP
jgi:hypothetical protein